MKTKKQHLYFGVLIKRQGPEGDWWGFVKVNNAWEPKYEAMTLSELKQFIRIHRGA